MRKYTVQQLRSVLETLPLSNRLVLALSGGIDSMVLLHSLAQLSQYRDVTIAIHVNHGLAVAADEWQKHCEVSCRSLEIPLQIVAVNTHLPPGESPEAWAREQRYRVLNERMQANDSVLTAHHQDDQAETVLLQLLRGAGPHGLAAMPQCKTFGPGRLVRPLLDFSRTQLQHYALEHHLDWVEDPSNADIRYDRNLIRQQVLPLLRKRWPGCGKTLSRAARWQAESATVVDQVAAQDLQRVAHSEGKGIVISRLQGLLPTRQTNLLRYWIRHLGVAVPRMAQLSQIQDELCHARRDAEPYVRWAGVICRRYRDVLSVCAEPVKVDSGRVWHWVPGEPLDLEAGLLLSHCVQGCGLKASLCENAYLEVRFRQGGERCRPEGRQHSRSLKKLLQEAEIPPWQRQTLPLIFIDGEFAAVAGQWVCESFQALGDEPGWRLDWYSAADSISRSCSETE